MIKLKISDLLNSTETLQKLAQKDFKAKVAWQIGRLLKTAETEIQGFNETRMNLIKKYGEKDETGELITDDKGNCKINPEGAIDFNTELNDLLNQEIEINANKISIEDLSESNFTPGEMAQLEAFIDTGEKEE